MGRVKKGDNKGVYVSIAILVLFILLLLGFMMSDRDYLIEKIVFGGYIPRIFAWTSLLIGVYGMARRRFSPLVTMLFFFIAFFFAYIGKYIVPIIY